MFKTNGDILKIIKNRLERKDQRFNSLFEDENLTSNPIFNEIIQEINTYHAEILAQNDELIEKEHILIKNEEELKSLFFDAPLPYIVLDKLNKIIKYNTAAKELLNLNHYRNFFIYKYLNGTKAYDEYFEFINNPEIKNIEIEILDVNNQVKFLEVNKGKTYINEMPATLLTLKDITDIKRLEKIEQENTKLKSMNQMINNIAHHWRQPLNLISISASTLEFKYTDEEDKILLENIVNTTCSLSETINLFKNIIDIDNLNITKDLFNIINEAILSVDRKLNDNSITIINDISSKSKSLLENQKFKDFTKVIIILLNNSIDSIIINKPENPWIKLDIDYKKRDEKIIISIEDNGGGIKEDIFDNIFEPYTTTKHQSSGVGLSLYLAYKTVTEILNGSIYAVNTDFGAKFYLEIPLQ